MKVTRKRRSVMKKFPFFSLLFLSAVGFSQDWQALDKELKRHREESLRIDLQVEKENKRMQLKQAKKARKQMERQERVEEIEYKKALISAKTVRVNALGTVGSSVITDKGVLYEGMQTPYGVVKDGKVGEFLIDAYGIVERVQLQVQAGGTFGGFGGPAGFSPPSPPPPPPPPQTGAGPQPPPTQPPPQPMLPPPPRR